MSKEEKLSEQEKAEKEYWEREKYEEEQNELMYEPEPPEPDFIVDDPSLSDEEQIAQEEQLRDDWDGRIDEGAIAAWEESQMKSEAEYWDSLGKHFDSMGESLHDEHLIHNSMIKFNDFIINNLKSNKPKPRDKNDYEQHLSDPDETSFSLDPKTSMDLDALYHEIVGEDYAGEGEENETRLKQIFNDLLYSFYTDIEESVFPNTLDATGKPYNRMPIGSINYEKIWNIQIYLAKVTGIGNPGQRNSKKDNQSLIYQDIKIEDHTGTIIFTVWQAHVGQLKIGDVLKISGACNSTNSSYPKRISLQKNGYFTISRK
tara:strand:- start:336 stop:1283 length:948 start_codon:yes stop_codon:yes gene_type:complete